MANSSVTSNRRSLVRRPFKEFLSRLSSNSADRTGLASANLLAGSQTIVSKPSTSSVLVQSSSKTVAVSPTAHSVSTSPAPADPLAQNILNAALQHLEQREREIIEEYISPNDGIPSLLLTIYTACQEKRELCEKRRWAFTLRGRTVRLRDEVDNVTKWLDRFKQVGDIAVNADPIHAGLPWAGIRLLLEVCVFIFILPYFKPTMVAFLSNNVAGCHDGTPPDGRPPRRPENCSLYDKPPGPLLELPT